MRPIADTIDFIGLILRTILYFNPMKVFLPLALGMIGIGTIVGIFQAIIAQNVSTVSFLMILTGLQTLVLGLLADLIIRRER